MSYCTIDDLKEILPEAALIQLADDENRAPAAIDPQDENCTAIVARLEKAITDADGEIDAYCAKYSVPFATAPAIIRKLSADMAVYNLYSRRVEEIPQARTDRYRNAVRLLEGIAKGTVSLGEDPPPAAKNEGGPEATTSRGERVFTRKTLGPY